MLRAGAELAASQHHVKMRLLGFRSYRDVLARLEVIANVLADHLPELFRSNILDQPHEPSLLAVGHPLPMIPEARANCLSQLLMVSLIQNSDASAEPQQLQALADT